MITHGTAYNTEYFDDVWFKLNTAAKLEPWYPEVINSIDYPKDADESWPFVTFCLVEHPVPPTKVPTESPTQSPTPSPTPSPTESPTDLPTDAPTSSPLASPTMAP